MTTQPHKNKPGRSKRTPLDALRTKLWFAWVRRQIAYGSVGKTVTELEARISVDSERLFYKYAKGQNSPSDFTLKIFDTAYPGSREVFEKGFCNLFPILSSPNLRQAVNLLREEVAHEHEALPDAMCMGDTTSDWLQNITGVLVKRAIQERRLMPLALVAGIIEARFLDKNVNLTQITPAALKKLCQVYPGLTPEDVAAAIPEVAEALERHAQWDKIDHCLASEAVPPHDTDPIGIQLEAFLAQNDHLSLRLQHIQFMKFMAGLNEVAQAPKC